jgi:beta-lactamase regulating signal transducer with metallopeptidase domain
MIQVTQSPLLQALGYAIINSLWQFGLLWLIYLFINCIVKLSSHQKYTAAIALQFSGFAWFCGTLMFYYNQCVYLANTGAVFADGFSGFGQMPYSASIKDKVFMVLMRTEQFLPYLSVAYLLLLVVLATKWLNSYRYTRDLRDSGIKKIDVNHRLFVDRLCHQLGIKRTVKVFLSELVKSPLTIGFLKPIILIPVASINYLSADQLEAVLLHELAHIKRFDYLINLVLSIVEVALFFNPFMQLLSRHIKRERENSCDDWVLQYEYNAANYAKALLKLATFNTTANVPSFAMNAIDQNQTLLIRVKRMIEKKDRSFNYRNQLMALLLISGVLSSVAWFSPASTNTVAANAVASTPQPLMVEPLVATVDNPLFNPAFFLVTSKEDQLKEALKLEMNFDRELPPGNKASVHSVSVHRPNNIKQVILPEAPQLMLTDAQLKAENAFAPLNNLQWKLDTIHFKTDFVNAFKNIGEEWMIVDKELKKVNNMISVNRAALSQFSVNPDKVKKEVERALSKLRTMPSKKEQLKLLAIAEKASQMDEENRRRYEKIYNEEELEAISELTQKQLEKVNYVQGYGQAAAPHERVQGRTYVSETPAVVYSTPLLEKVHTYSYDYVEKPGSIKIAVTASGGTPAPVPASAPVAQRKQKQGCKEVDIVAGKEAIDVNLESTPPAQTIKISTRKKIIKIIKI